MNKHDKLTPHFSFGEFWSSSAEGKRRDVPPPSDVLGNLRDLAAQLEVLRAEANRVWGPCSIWVTPNGGYRTPEHNDRQGGAPRSAHLTGQAADIRVRNRGRDVNTGLVAGMVRRLILEGAIEDGGVGVYPGFVHYDTAGDGRRWDERG